jgi:branched-chain amino acid transport system ATP-binding protein
MSDVASPDPLLEVEGLEVAYGGIQAVKGIDLEIRSGELVALIGANGAGKTTTLKTLCGLLRPSAGRISYAGEDASQIPAHGFAQRGLVMVPEGRGVFSRLSVHENLQMGAYCRNDHDVIAADIERIYGLFPRLKERYKQLAGTLSGGEQQMVAIGRAMLSRPRLLLLDEPSMGLAPLIVHKIFEIIRQIASEGVTMLLVEQNARLALKTAQRGYVMESGRITCTDSAEALLANPKVQHAYLGE